MKIHLTHRRIESMQKTRNSKVNVGEDRKRGNTYMLLMGMKTGNIFMENSTKSPQILKLSGLMIQLSSIYLKIQKNMNLQGNILPGIMSHYLVIY